MKIVDKTPLLDEKGNLGLMQRIQGMLEYGFNWPRELEAQNAIVRFFDRQLEKGYTLIRNMALGQSGIMIPMILLGPSGIYVIEVTHLRGRYEARDESWNVESGDQYKPAPVNLIKQTMRMARALQAFIERQGVRIPVGIEPVIIAGDPGLHIESVRPAIKVMMIDGIKSFVNSLTTGRPVLTNEQVHNFTDRILNPRVKQDEPPTEPPVLQSEQEPKPRAAWEEMYGWNEEPQQPPQASHAGATFDTSQDVQPFNPNEFGFAMSEEEASAATSEIPPVLREPAPDQSVRGARPKQQRFLGMTPVQLTFIGVLVVLLVSILAALAYVVMFL